jgi:hypothetical protein
MEQAQALLVLQMHQVRVKFFSTEQMVWYLEDWTAEHSK